MNPLILNFKEKPKEIMESFSRIKYQEKLNLSTPIKKKGNIYKLLIRLFL